MEIFRSCSRAKTDLKKTSSELDCEFSSRLKAGTASMSASGFDLVLICSACLDLLTRLWNPLLTEDEGFTVCWLLLTGDGVSVRGEEGGEWVVIFGDRTEKFVVEVDTRRGLSLSFSLKPASSSGSLMFAEERCEVVVAADVAMRGSINCAERSEPERLCDENGLDEERECENGFDEDLPWCVGGLVVPPAWSAVDVEAPEDTDE